MSMKTAYLCLFGATFIWGLQAVMMKLLLTQYSAITVVMMRCTLMVICYFIVVYAASRRIVLPTLKQLKILAVMGFCCIPVNNVVQFEDSATPPLFTARFSAPQCRPSRHF